MPADHRLLSLVVPILNEELVLRETYARLTGVLEKLGQPFEVIVTDNGSTDASAAIARDICSCDPRWKYVRLSRNFGYQNSITAGMMAARGEAIMVVDADLQDPPELIPDFVARWREGYDVVYGIREKRRGESKWRVIPTMFAMRFITWMSDDVKLPLHSGDFRLISRRVRDALARLHEGHRYVRGLIHWLGFRQIGIPYTRQGRLAGASKAHLAYLIGFTFNAVFTSSWKPLRLFTFAGAFVLALALVLTVAHLAGGRGPDMQPGVAAILLLLVATLGTLALGIGVLGEYLARTYDEARRRPLWLVDYTLNLDAAASDAVGDRQRTDAADTARDQNDVAPPLAA